MGKDRFFDVVPGYCPWCKQNVFFANTLGVSGRCPECKTFVIGIRKKPEDYVQVAKR